MFQLRFDIPESSKKIQLSDKIISLGSCFAEHVGTKLSAHKFETLSNPFGTLFHPLAIFNALSANLPENEIIKNQDVYYHWAAHGEISALDRSTLLETIKRQSGKLQDALKTTKWIILTFGTSFVYEHLKSGNVVANCHKVPQSEFEKRLLSPQEIYSKYSECLKTLREYNPELEVILAISPVRHIRDGLHENNVSKGILHQAVTEILQKDPKASYFPSYEIMIDELRDYRFYDVDRVHPNNEAIDYIWKKFREVFISPETNGFIDNWDKIISALNHRPFHPESYQHQSFLIKLRAEIENLAQKVDVTKELELVDKRLQHK
jgi:lysophospholipase L1-like esterase